MNVSRRVAVQVGAVGLVGAALAVGGVALVPGVSREARRPLQALDPLGFSVLAAVAERVCPAVGGLPSAWDLEVPEAVDGLLAGAHSASVADVVQLLHLLESGLLALALDGRPLRFTASGPTAQDRALAAWRDSGLEARRSGYKVLVSLVSASYWANPATWKHLGYGGPPRFGPPEVLPSGSGP